MQKLWLSWLALWVGLLSSMWSVKAQKSDTTQTIIDNFNHLDSSSQNEISWLLSNAEIIFDTTTYLYHLLGEDWDTLSTEYITQHNELVNTIRKWIREIDFLNDDPIYSISTPNWETIVVDLVNWKLKLHNWVLYEYDIHIDNKKMIDLFWWVKKRIIKPLNISNERDCIHIDGEIKLAGLEIKNKRISYNYIIEKLLVIRNSLWEDAIRSLMYYPEAGIKIELVSRNWSW